MTDTIDTEQAFILYETLARKGRAYSTVSGGSHYNETIVPYGSEPTGNSRIYGDADAQTQLASMQAIIGAATTVGLTDEFAAIYCFNLRGKHITRLTRIQRSAKKIFSTTSMASSIRPNIRSGSPPI
jgi:hypothetical protein